MPVIRAVMDTNVLVSAARSRRGASNALLAELRVGRWRIVLSNHLLLEYEEVLKRESGALSQTLADIDGLLDSLCAAAELVHVRSPWRLHLSDPDDEMLVQLAVESGANLITTHNIRDLTPAAGVGVRVLRPLEFLNLIRTSS